MLIFAMNKPFLWTVQKIDISQDFCTLLKDMIAVKYLVTKR